MEINELGVANDVDLVRVNNLLKQLVHDSATYKPVAFSRWEEIIGDKKTVVITVREDGEIIGMGMLFLILKPRGFYASIEEMMVDEAHRGKGIGEAIGRKLIEVAKERGVETIELSARPSRVPANKLYQKLGFLPKETNVYRLKL
jgi:ribosomal protein S18 acetylase RimI-like enzyme